MIRTQMGPLIEALKNPSWQFIIMAALTVVLGAAGILIPWLLARSKKELSYRVLTNTPVVSVREEYQGRVEIIFHGRRVKNVRLLIFKLVNSGHKAIRSEDYEEPLVVRLGETSNILSATVVHAHPPEIRQAFAEVIANSAGQEIPFPPVLLNSGDWIRVNILVSDFQGPVTVTGRIVDVKEIKELRDYSVHLAWVVFSICSGLTAIALVLPFASLAKYLLVGALIGALMLSTMALTKKHKEARQKFEE